MCDALNASIAALDDDDAFANRTSYSSRSSVHWRFLTLILRLLGVWRRLVVCLVIIIVVVHPFYSQLTFLWIFFAGKFGSSTNLLVPLRPPHHIISKRVLRQESSSVAASCSSLELLPLGIDVIGRLLWVPREHTRKGTQART